MRKTYENQFQINNGEPLTFTQATAAMFRAHTYLRKSKFKETYAGFGGFFNSTVYCTWPETGIIISGDEFDNFRNKGRLLEDMANGELVIGNIKINKEKSPMEKYAIYIEYKKERNECRIIISDVTMPEECKATNDSTSRVYTVNYEYTFIQTNLSKKNLIIFDKVIISLEETVVGEIAQ